MDHFSAWMSDPNGGKTYCYLQARGHWLAETRERARRKGYDALSAKEGVFLAAAAYAVDLYLAGRVELVQRVVARGIDGGKPWTECEYLAVRRNTRAERPQNEWAAWETWRKNIGSAAKRPRPRLPAEAA